MRQLGVQLGVEYYTGLVVCTDVVNDMPVFMKIICIFLRNDVVLLVSEMETIFVEHFHAFRVVDNMHNVSVVRPHDLRYFKPFDVQNSFILQTHFCILCQTAALYRANYRASSCFGHYCTWSLYKVVLSAIFPQNSFETL